jgi:hypothetical protein
MDWLFSIAVSIYFLNSDGSGAKSKEPDEEKKRNNTRESCALNAHAR